MDDFDDVSGFLPPVYLLQQYLSRCVVPAADAIVSFGAKLRDRKIDMYMRVLGSARRFDAQRNLYSKQHVQRVLSTTFPNLSDQEVMRVARQLHLARIGFLLRQLSGDSESGDDE